MMGEQRRSRGLVYCAVAALLAVVLVVFKTTKGELRGLSLEGLKFTPSSSQQQQPSSIETSDTEVDSDNIEESYADNEIKNAINAKPVDNNPSEEVIAQLRQQLDSLEQEVKKLAAMNEKLLGSALEAQVRIERVEDAAFSDGTNAFVAVMENAFFSPTGKRWVKLCDWDLCQMQTLNEGVKNLFARQFKGKKTTTNDIRAVHIVESCPSTDNIYTRHLNTFLGLNHVAVVQLSSSSTSPSQNCSHAGGYHLHQVEALDRINDKTLDVIIFEGNGHEDTKPVLYSLLKTWSPKLRIGGIALGQDYFVTKPFHARWQPEIVASPHQTATKKAVDLYRTGDDNELGQDDTVRVGGGSLWYFTKIRASIFGR